MYGCFTSVGIDDLDVGLKLLHVVIVCCITPIEEHVETFFVIYHGPYYWWVCLHARFFFVTMLRRLPSYIQKIELDVIVVKLSIYNFLLVCT